MDDSIRRFFEGRKLRQELPAYADPQNRRATTTAVKQALAAAGHPNPRAKSGTGTAWAWLMVNVDRDEAKWPEWRDQYNDAQSVATTAAEREDMRGDYGSQINVSVNEEKLFTEDFDVDQWFHVLNDQTKDGGPEAKQMLLAAIDRDMAEFGGGGDVEDFLFDTGATRDFASDAADWVAGIMPGPEFVATWGAG